MPHRYVDPAAEVEGGDNSEVCCGGERVGSCRVGKGRNPPRASVFLLSYPAGLILTSASICKME
jgi:hypothetical protein